MASLSDERIIAKMWELLVDLAQRKRVRYYEEAARELDIAPINVGRVLEPIQSYCLARQKPPLTILIINKATGLPGGGFIAWDAARLPEGRKEVYAYPWREDGNPYAYALSGGTRAEMIEQTLGKDGDFEAIYERCGGRGALQAVFRGALMRAYEGRCAFSGSSAVEALEAAHIVPWTKATRKERADPRNGLLLNAYFHRLFDAQVLTISERLDIVLVRRSFLD